MQGCALEFLRILPVE